MLSICQYTSAERYPQSVDLTVTWNKNFIIEGKVNVTGEYSC